MTAHTIRDRTDQGELIVAPTTVYSPDEGVVEGIRHVAALDSQNIWDTKLDSPIYLQGGSFWIRNASSGDYGELAVVDKDDVLGLFAYYGIPSGGVLELRKHVRTFHFPPGSFQDRVEFSSKSYIPAGLYMREIYFSTATTGDQPVMAVQYKFYEV